MNNRTDFATVFMGRLSLRARDSVFSACLVGVLAVLSAGGCKTLTPEQQFEPVPVATVESQELEPAAPPSVVELIRAAQDAFEAGNAAQERGENAAALRQYSLMLELLVEADLDPKIFYNLKDQFAAILESTAQQAPLYERMRPPHAGEVAYGSEGISDLTIEFPLADRVLTEIDEIQKLYPKNFQAGLNRSTKYIPHIQAKLAEAGLPQDLVWLVMVESQFTPKIISRAGAGGMWQFMRTTGRRYNLRIDSYVDERFNWCKSTDAAVQFLTDLYEMFDTWPLAISAYNMGEGGLERAIAANGGERDLWTLLDTPPAAYQIQLETKKFYAKLLASIIVAKNPDRYGFTLEPQAPDVCVTVPVNGSYSLSSLNTACELSAGTLERLNPDLIRGITPPDSYQIVVPAEAQSKVLAALKKVSEVTYASSGGPGGSHTVRRGETLSAIADRYKVNPKDLMKANNIKSANRLQVGKKLVIPGGGVETPVQTNIAPVASEGPRKVYRVKRGDTLYDIAKAHRISANDLLAWNKLKAHARIQVGQSLYVSPPSSEAAPVTETVSEPLETVTPEPAPAHEEPADSKDETGKISHVVRAGEYPAKIARQHGVPLEDLLRWNGMDKTSTIQIGDTLTVYTKGGAPKDSADETTEESAAPVAAKTHKVAKGDTAGSIATKYGVKLSDLLKWNNLTTKSVLRIGQELVVSTGGKAAKSSESAKKETSSTETEKKETAPAEVKGKTHVVAKGDTAGSIATKYGVKLSDLFEWNNLTSKSVLRIGQKLTVSGGGEEKAASLAPAEEKKSEEKPEKEVKKESEKSSSSASSGEKTTHVVAKGETPSAIAEKYNATLKELYQWNGWQKTPVLNIGQKVTVYKK